MELDPFKRIAVTVKVQNGLLKQAVVNTGLTVKQLSDAVPIAIGTVYGLLNMTVSPFCAHATKSDKNGSDTIWSGAVLRLCAYLGVAPEDVFPADMWEPLKRNRVTFFANYDRSRICGNASTSSVKMLNDRDTSRSINKLLSIMSPRQRDVIRDRFGLGGEAPKTLKEVAAKYEVTSETIRQVEARAIRKVRSKLHYDEKMSEEFRSCLEGIASDSAGREFAKAMSSSAEAEDGDVIDV